jgi:hypothetical protein
MKPISDDSNEYKIFKYSRLIREYDFDGKRGSSRMASKERATSSKRKKSINSS